MLSMWRRLRLLPVYFGNAPRPRVNNSASVEDPRHAECESFQIYLTVEAFPQVANRLVANVGLVTLAPKWMSRPPARSPQRRSLARPRSATCVFFGLTSFAHKARAIHWSGQSVLD